MDKSKPAARDPAAEVARLHGCVRDLVALSRLPAIGDIRDPGQLAGNLAEALQSTLRLSLVYVRLKGLPGTGPFEAVRVDGQPEIQDRAREIGKLLRSHHSSVGNGGVSSVLDPTGHRPIRVVARPIGPRGKWGRVYAGAWRSDFPTDLDRTLLSVAANQAAMALQEASTDDSLRRSQQELEGSFETAMIGLHLLDRHGIILRANRADVELLGYTRDEYVGRNITEFHVEPERMHAILRRLLRGETVRDFQARLRHKDGSIRHVLVDSNGCWEERRFIHSRCFTRDITAQKRAEIALRESEERFRTLCDAAPIGIYQADTTGAVIYTNPRWQALSGLTAEESLGFGWVRADHPDDRERVLAQWRAAASARHEFYTEARMSPRPGEVHWVIGRAAPILSEEGEVTGYVGTVEDITARKTAEEALQASEARFRTLTEAVPQLIWTADARGECTYLSGQWSAFTGVPETAPLEERCYSVIHPDDRDRVVAALGRAADGGEGGYDVEYRIRRHDGEYRWFQSRAVPVLDPEGRVQQWFGTCTDVHDRRLAVAALRASESRYRSLNEELERHVALRTGELTQSIEALNAEMAERRQAEQTSRAQADTLLRTTEQLTQEHARGAFTSIVLAAISEQLGADFLALWLLDPETGILRLDLVFQDGGAIPGGGTGFPYPSFTREEALRDPFWERLAHERRATVYDLETIRELAPRMPDYLVAHGVQQVIAVPLWLGSDFIGVLSTGLATTDPIPPQTVTLAQALAHLATLAICLARLTEQAREAAVLQEREQVAAERLADLTRANKALMHTLETLSDAPELERFLGTVIAATAEQLGAASSALWLFEEGGSILQLDRLYRDGKVVSGDESTYPQRTMSVHDLEHEPGWRTLVNERRPIVHDVEHSSVLLPPARDALTTEGVTQALVVPLALGDELVGILSIRLRDGDAIVPGKVELAHALAHQATLAIHMARLAEQAGRSAVFEERNRMAREIHDTLAQAFTGIILQTGSAGHYLGLDEPRCRASLESIQELAREGLAEARVSVYALRPQSLEQHDLASALERMAVQMQVQGASQVWFELHGTPRSIRDAAADQLLRIGQEALTNALRHASARNIRLDLTFSETAIRLHVQDDGRGFAAGIAESFGLRGMRERAGLLGAELTISSDPATGTSVDVFWPVSRQ